MTAADEVFDIIIDDKSVKFPARVRLALVPHTSAVLSPPLQYPPLRLSHFIPVGATHTPHLFLHPSTSQLTYTAHLATSSRLAHNAHEHLNNFFTILVGEEHAAVSALYSNAQRRNGARQDPNLIL